MLGGGALHCRKTRRKAAEVCVCVCVWGGGGGEVREVTTVG